MPEHDEEVKPVSVAKPRDNVYTVMQVLAAAFLIVSVVLLLMELQAKDPSTGKNPYFGAPLFGGK